MAEGTRRPSLRPDCRCRTAPASARPSTICIDRHYLPQAAGRTRLFLVGAVPKSGDQVLKWLIGHDERCSRRQGESDHLINHSDSCRYASVCGSESRAAGPGRALLHQPCALNRRYRKVILSRARSAPRDLPRNAAYDSRAVWQGRPVEALVGAQALRHSGPGFRSCRPAGWKGDATALSPC